MAKPKPAIDANLIRELAQLLDETGLSEIEIERDGQRVRVVKNRGGNQVPTYAVSAPPLAESPPTSPAPADNGAAGDPHSHPGAVKSPMVGTAYRSPEPGAPPRRSWADRDIAAPPETGHVSADAARMSGYREECRRPEVA